MSVIQRIRDKGAWFIFGIIALALIAFILQDGSFRKGSLFANTTTVGKVNGEKIERNEFEAKIDFFQQMQGVQSTQRDKLRNDVWDYMVEDIVMKQEFKKLGLGFTAKDLNEALFGINPPQFLKQQFTDPKTGAYKADEAKAYIAQVKTAIKKNNPQASLFYEAYIQPLEDQSVRQKYQSLITGAVYIPKWLAEKQSADNNAISSFSYVYVPYNNVTDTAIKVRDEEITAYVQKHPKQFEQEEETRTVSYVTFDATPTKSDSDVVLKQVSDLKPEFTATNDAKSFVGAKGSDLPYSDSYVSKSNFKTRNADSITSLSDGQVFGPYLDNQDYSLAKLIGRRSLPDSAKCRHILIKTAQGSQQTLPDSIAKKRIDSIETAIKGGADFATLVTTYSDDDGSKATKGEYTFSSTQFETISKEFAETIFYGKTGDKKVVKVANAQYSGYHYIEVLDQKNFQEALKVAYISKPIIASSETVNNAANAAVQFAAASKDKSSFEDNALKQKKIPIPSPEIKQNDYALPALGESRQLIRWIYEHKVGEVSEPIAIGDHNVVAVVSAINKAGLQSVLVARPKVENILKNEKKAAQIIGSKIKGTTLEAVAQSAGVNVQRADSVSFQSQFIPAVGSEPKIIGASFNKALQNKISSPVTGNGGVFILKGESVSAKASLNGNPELQRQALQSQLIQQVGYRSMLTLRKTATVTDNRSVFY